jgi:short-subunit dehydrogenase
VTGASSGIGLELAKLCARDGFDLLMAADTPVEQAAAELSALGASVEAVEVDLSTTEGVDQLCERVAGRTVDALIANAGHGLGKAFMDQDWQDIRHVIDTNVVGTTYLVHKIGRQMRERGFGKILITGSIAGFEAGAFQAVYNASKAFDDSFAAAIRNELKDSGVTVTCLMPGATETEFFERADLEDTKVGQSKKMEAAEVAEQGFKAMMDGDPGVITGWKNKMQVAMARMMPSSAQAEQHRKQAEPGSAFKH